MKKYAFIAIASVAFLTSCNDTKKEAATDATVATENTSTEPSSVNVATETAPVAEGMNPEHGQPGHRCDIPVGTPLSTPAGSGAVTPTATSTAAEAQPFLVNEASKAGTAANTGKLNPAHGEPGHRCDIAVGQPL